MAVIKMHFGCVAIYGVLTWTAISGITLPGQQPTRQTKHSQTSTIGSGSLVTPPHTAPVTESNEGIAEYRVRANRDQTCILLKTDGVIEIYYKLHNDPDDKISEYLPSSPAVDGDCKYEDKSSMSIKWKGHSLIWIFGKTPGRERWFITSVELTIDSDLPKYKNVGAKTKKFTLAHRQMLIPTPAGRSYSCDELVIDLIPDEDDTHSPPGLRGKLFLRTIQLQPFMYKGNEFEPQFDCNSQLGFRDETAPIAVGSTLAIAVLGTVTGYGVYRYFKINKVQYNTMG